jgi:LysM repeat protein
MKRYLNTHARIKRALRNNQKIYSAAESFKRFKWFALAVILLLPIYPTLGLLGTDLEARAGNYDETTIITAYEGDDAIEGSYINKSGLVSTDFDVVSKAVKKKAIEGGKDEKATAYTVIAGDTLISIGKKYGISSDAILWSNDISESELLRPGTIIRIPPVSGVMYKVIK